MTEKTLQDQYFGGTTVLSAERIGLISDSHSADADGSDLPEELFQAFEDVDAIVHLGHLGVKEQLGRGALDRLAKIAPVLAVQDFARDSDGNLFLTPPDGDRVKGLSRVIEVNGVRIGVIHNLASEPGPEIPAPAGGFPEFDTSIVNDVLASKFEGPVDVVAFASTHRAVAITAGGVLFVNPGSPTYPRGPGRVAGQQVLGSVGVLTAKDGVVAFELRELSWFTPNSG
jgi:hypothetical protein